ncbi:hypothetical protein GMORB2_7794 [Geosmithia morbida]|uniref:Uncharacterized protein n=1 Tax=Geosmithia morbida TaxID=1094350 RepID=A0A9P4YV00_9HYPO|nr:uncharacterized protein GMORB2_7794 [Geosmithia morbida]KAF4122201.1 hypothetical protein GMORB2_7794 [Geosmithia morbida]
MARRPISTAYDTQYCSFHDIELVAPSSPPNNMVVSDSRRDKHADPSTNTSTGAAVSRTRARPSTRRSGRSHYHGNSVHMPPSVGATATPKQQLSYFQFPPPDPMDDELDRSTNMSFSHPTGQQQRRQQQQQQTLLPQTTHYWTSDQTRRLEYAAIDAASCGVKGWIRRHLPDCIGANSSKRHISFDDDTGSVRRYRLELEEDDHKGDENPAQSRKPLWRFWVRDGDNSQ